MQQTSLTHPPQDSLHNHQIDPQNTSRSREHTANHSEHDHDGNPLQVHGIHAQPTRVTPWQWCGP